MRLTAANRDGIDMGGIYISPALSRIREMVQSCIQCGTCSGSCPNEFAMDHTPRMLWRMLLMGQEDAIFRSRTFSLCSACYTCALRCPRGLPLTDAMAALKQVAADRSLSRYRTGSLFYRKFMDSVRRHGRVREMEMMALYLNAMKNPLLPLRFAALGLKLMHKGKVAWQWPSKGHRPLEDVFNAVEKMESGRNRSGNPDKNIVKD